ncbi:cilia- and flagella-associated protein 184-like [Bombus flavifrons]|uniref:cilia- and flagella-associated protein 184-like n=1 Tax=Bombus flavifrons TaxID=103934 RepID=UPI003704A0D1
MTPPPQKENFNVALEHDEDKITQYKFDVSYSLEDFGLEREEEEARSEDGESEKEVESAWNVITDLFEDDRYEEEEFHEEKEVGEEEEMSLTTTVSTIEEKVIEEAPSPVESEHVFAEIPIESPAERETIIDKLRELLSERSNLKRKNRLLEIWVTRNMKKTQQRMTPSDSTKTREQMEETYKEALREYKMQVDEILTREAELTYEMQNYTQKVMTLKEEDDRIFGLFLNRQKEISVGLVFSKTGRKLTEKMMDNLIRRQTTRRLILARDRQSYVFLQHRLDDLNMQLKIAETLGEGMTTMDYEALHIANCGYKDRLDERDRELERLRIKIAETVNGVAQYKEKEVCITEDIEFEQKNLDRKREENTKIRERVNNAHVALNEIRETLNERSTSAGLLVAQQELIEMQKMITMKKELKAKIELIKQEIELYHPMKQKIKKS